MSQTLSRKIAIFGGAVLALLLAAAAVLAIVDPTGEGFFHKRVYDVVLGGAALLVLLRALAFSENRKAWTGLGMGMLLWTAGNVYYSTVLYDLEVIPVPSMSDGLWLGFYLIAIPCLGSLMTDGKRSKDKRASLDGLLTACSIAAVVCATVLDSTLGNLGGKVVYAAIGLAYPVMDLMLVGMLVGAAALRGWRMTAQMRLIALGAAIFVVVDFVYMIQTINGTWKAGNILEGAWPLVMLVLAAAAWTPMERKTVDLTADSWWAIAVPCSLTLVSLTILVVDHFERVNNVALILVTASVLIVIVRMFLSFSGHLALIRISRQHALTDVLTGLGNRRSLERDVENLLLDPPDGQVILGIFDLDGFKGYNDSFGHPAGDALLIRLGKSLTRTMEGRGKAYRLGGDEFCVLATVSEDGVDSLVAASKIALSSLGKGFSVTASGGYAAITPTGGYAEAMRTADQLLYVEKNGGRFTAGMQTTSVLLKVLSELDPELSLHVHDVKDLAVVTASRLGLEGKALEDVRQAAALHDIGKIAIPDSILSKPGPLTEPEWAFMRRHTLIGQRILDAAPAMKDVGLIVRSSHERYDGTGYPDQLAGDEILLGARIIGVSDAWDAMTNDRTYAAARSEADARAELLRCSGTQFDPLVVSAFLATLDEKAQTIRRVSPATTEPRFLHAV